MTFWDVVAKDPEGFLFASMVAFVVLCIALVRIVAHLKGKVYTGVLVQTKTVQAGDGVTTGVRQSKVIYVSKEPFIAPNASAAATILSSRAARDNKDLNFEDPSAPIEAQVSQVGGAL